jgi:cytochrome P450 family 12
MIRNSSNINFKSFLARRNLSVKTAISLKSEDGLTKRFEEMPTLSRFELMGRFMKGGKFHNTSMLDINKMLREELGTIYRMPGMFGQRASVTTFDADDIEYVHRNEGVYPFRRGMETLKYFREKIRPDVFNVGGLMVE